MAIDIDVLECFQQNVRLIHLMDFHLHRIILVPIQEVDILCQNTHTFVCVMLLRYVI